MGYWFFFFKQKTAYEIRNCDWSSDVCSSDLSNGWVGYEVREAEAGEMSAAYARRLER